MRRKPVRNVKHFLIDSTVNNLYRFTPSDIASSPEFTSKGFIIYPNPVTDELVLESNEHSIGSVKSVEVFDMTGRCLNLITNNFEKIFVSSLSKGNYFLKIKTQNGIHVSKFIKE